LDDLKSMGLENRIDALVLSGDFSWLGGMDEFYQARIVVEEIMNRLRLSPDRVLMIPGNHDITWDQPSPTLAPSHHGKAASRQNYDIFFELVMKRKPPAEAELLAVPSRSGQNKLRVLGLDSNRVEAKEAAGLGFVSREAFQEAARLLEADPIDGYARVFTWAAVHHHVFPATAVRLEQAQSRKVSLMGNTSELQEYAGQWQVEVILHGHEHQPSVTVSHRWPMGRSHSFTPLTAIGAGSFSVNRELLGPLSRNHYYVLYRRANDLVIRSRQNSESIMNFVPHNDVVFDPAKPITLTNQGYQSKSGRADLRHIQGH
jgi:3',5'-cyclic AMP phosphodiesterase CpdA